MMGWGWMSPPLAGTGKSHQLDRGRDRDLDPAHCHVRSPHAKLTTAVLGPVELKMPV